MRIEIPRLAVVALVGASGSGKSTFAKRHFLPTEVLSSDGFRGLISDDESDQSVTQEAFETLYYVAGKRLDLGRLTVIDATNVQRHAREQVLKLAKEQDCFAVAIVLDIPEKVCQARNRERSDRTVPYQVVSRHCKSLRDSLRNLRREGFRFVFVLKGQEEADACEIVRVPLWNDKRELTGPFDIVGDVHGCYDELCDLLSRLGYSVDPGAFRAVPPEGRTAVFLGDLCDRGPKNVPVLRLVQNMVREGRALCVAGNHDVKLARKLGGEDVKLTHGLDRTVAELAGEDRAFVDGVRAFARDLLSHYVLDGGKLVVAHAGLKEKYQGRGSIRVRNFCLYGDTTGETDEFGLPVLLPWAADYRGKALVVYGHTPVAELKRENNTICIDTGCVFGGRLTAFRYPEREIVQVDALAEYCPPVRPLRPVLQVGSAAADSSPAVSAPDDLLRVEDVLGRRHVATRFRRGVTISAESSAAALEVMSRFAADPHWLVYLPPTMSPCETSQLDGWLEHPREALGYYSSRGVKLAVCEEKHMGSRAVIAACRDSAAAARRFGVGDGSSGTVLTRAGRSFFDDVKDQDAVLSRLGSVLDATGFWEKFSTDWVLLDCELMPWSAKAQNLIKEQYAATGCAGRAGLAAAIDALARSQEVLDGHGAEGAAAGPALDLAALGERYSRRAEALEAYGRAYRRYCWEVKSPDDYRIAPFHVLATEGRTWTSESHAWHMLTVSEFVAGRDPVFVATDHRLVDLDDPASVAGAVAWWEELTASGGEGMVVKPLDFVSLKGREMIQPAVKCRGREYLRIIYGPEYLLGDSLKRLKKRSLERKRNLALNEFALGLEALERFVANEPLYRVHECVFGVLALESEPVDPRL
ncbi:MAG: polynucleotide kinase-phosphatase [Deltaproteobacteria bacterium]|jgi:protein phosphatase|nr:polynucleotide kinase-phosphatase [Deltaproteobacteria bacterium]